MHCVNLGIACLLIGCTLWFLVGASFHLLVPRSGATLPPGSSRDSILQELWIRFKLWLKRHRLTCSCKRFTIAAIGRSKTELCQFKCKAAQSPVIVSWLAELTLEVSTSDRLDARLKHQADCVAACVWGLASFFSVLKSAGRFLNDSELESLELASNTFLNMYSEMTRASPDPAHLWHLTPKFHQFQHIVMDCVEDRENPCFFHCFGDEDMVGRMLRVARKQHANTLPESAAGTYLAGLLLRLEGRARAEHN